MTSRHTQWRPILSADQQRRAAHVIESIARALPGANTSRDDLAGGSPGPALFFAYLDMARAASAPVADRRLMLRAALDQSFPETIRPSLMHGQTGIVWAARQLRSYVDADELERVTREVEDLLLARLSAETLPEGFELFRGLVGYARFGLDAAERPGSRRIAERAISRLAGLADPEGDGVRWWTESPRRPQTRHIRLGLAHGVPGPIAALAEACHAGIETTVARPLLDRAVRWLLAQRNPEGISTSLFGTLMCLQDDDIDRRQCRLAWCWGDLGIGAALHAAAVHVGDASWSETALEIARHAARRAMDDAGVVSAGLCHGSAGAGHIFNRLYQNTRDPIFKTAARQWFDRTLDYAEAEAPPPSSDPAAPPVGHPWPAEPGLLSGLSGAGLALLAASTSIEPMWDRIFLISMTPRPEHGDAGDIAIESHAHAARV